MTHSEPATLLTFNEPADGTVLVRYCDEAWTALIRDDKSAAREGRPAGEHWFDGAGFEARTLGDWVRPGVVLSTLGEKLAEF